MRRHLAELGQVIRTHHNRTQGQLIRELNAKIGGWTRYHRTVAAAKVFDHCEYILFLQLQQWARYRHPNKGKRWVAHKYWHVDNGKAGYSLTSTSPCGITRRPISNGMSKSEERPAHTTETSSIGVSDSANTTS